MNVHRSERSADGLDDEDDADISAMMMLPHTYSATEKKVNAGSSGKATEGRGGAGGDTKESPSHSLHATMFASPLVVDNGLTTEMSLRALYVSLDLLETVSMSPSVRVHFVSVAVMQLMVHITRREEV